MANISGTALNMFSLEQFVRSRNATLFKKNNDASIDFPHGLTFSVYGYTETTCLVAAYSLIILLSLIGNLTVCKIVCRVKNFHNSTYILLANIATSDLLITMLNIPFTLVKILYGEWIFGGLLCKMVNYTLMLSIYVSTTTMSAIAIGKYVTVIYPMRAKWTNLSVILLCVLIWVGSMLVSLPFLLFSHEKNVSMSLRMSTRCVVTFPEPSTTSERIMTAFTFVLQFLFPLITTSIAYGGIVCRIYDHFYRPIKKQNALLHHSCANLSSQFKLVKMLFLVVMVFTVCWLPLNIYHMIMEFYPGDFRPHSATYLTCHWFAMSSVCYNPIIYCWMHGAFRKQIRLCTQCFASQRPRLSTRSPPKMQETPVAM